MYKPISKKDFAELVVYFLEHSSENADGSVSREDFLDIAKGKGRVRCTMRLSYSDETVSFVAKTAAQYVGQLGWCCDVSVYGRFNDPGSFSLEEGETDAECVAGSPTQERAWELIHCLIRCFKLERDSAHLA